MKKLKKGKTTEPKLLCKAQTPTKEDLERLFKKYPPQFDVTGPKDQRRAKSSPKKRRAS